MTAPSAGADRVGSGSWHQFQLCTRSQRRTKSCRPRHPAACLWLSLYCLHWHLGLHACLLPQACAGVKGSARLLYSLDLQACRGRSKSWHARLGSSNAQGQFNVLDSFTCVPMRPARQHTYLARDRDRPPSPKQAAGSKKGREWNHPAARASSTGGVICADGQEGL